MKGITSPEGIIMLLVAVILDITGFVIFCLGTWFGIDDYGILEIIGIAIFGPWMSIRYGSLGSEGGMKVQENEEEAGSEESEEGQAMPEKDKPEKDKKEDTTNAQSQKKDDKATTKPESAKPTAKSSATTPAGGKTGGNSSKNSAGVAVTAPVSAKEIHDAIKTGDVKGLAKKALKKFGWTFLTELVPVLGGFWPGWTIFVWKEMKD